MNKEYHIPFYNAPTSRSIAKHPCVAVSQDSLTVDLVDGRTTIVPLVWHPRLWYGTEEERSKCEIIGNGTLLHRPDLDEDLSVVAS